jgi:hypothetical protein
VPMLFVVGERTSVASLNQLKLGYSVALRGQSTDQVTPYVNPAFALFVPYVDNTVLTQLPPLTIPFGDYPAPVAANVLLYQRIGAVETQRPLWYFTETGAAKTGFICGEGLWRWSLAEYMNHTSFGSVYELFSKTVQYLAVKTNNERLIIDIPEFSPSLQPVVAIARLYNKSNEPVNQYPVSFDLTTPDKQRFSYMFQPKGAFYQLDLGNLSSGKYTYTAKTTIGDEPFTRLGNFYIGESTAEVSDLVANHQILYQMAAQSGGIMVTPDSCALISEAIMANVNIKPVYFSAYQFTDWLNIKWLLALLALLLLSEWFLRKYWGLV